jgi:hypothetical protein
LRIGGKGYDLTPGSPLALVEPLLNDAKTPEIDPAIGAANRLCTQSQHKNRGGRGTIIVAAPSAEVHAMAGGAFRKREIAQAPDIGPESFIAIPTTEAVQAEQVENP